jgi:quercetin dioxygenase-like cupin family protein
VQTADAQPLNVLGVSVLIRLGTEDTSGNYAVLEERHQPHQGPPLHRHFREDEVFLVLEGQYRFDVDGRETIGGPGTCVPAPRGTVHAYEYIGDQPGRMLVIFQPAGMEKFFIDLSQATAGMQHPDMAVLVPVFNKYGVELIGPPLAARAAAGTGWH